MIKKIKFKSKKGGAELLLELILTTIIFFIIVVILFAFDVGNLKLNAIAHVIAVDSATACNADLNNLVRTPIGNITYGELLINSYVEEDYTDAANEASNILVDVYGSANYTLNFSGIEKTTLFSVGDLGCTEDKPCFTCEVYLPSPVPLMQECGASNFTTVTAEYPDEVILSVPDGDVSFFVQDQRITEVSEETGPTEKFGALVTFTDMVMLVEPESPYEEPPETLTFDTNFSDAIIIPLVLVKDGIENHYELYLEELGKDIDPTQEIFTGLVKRRNVEDCSLKLELTLPGFKRYEEYKEWEEAGKPI